MERPPGRGPLKAFLDTHVLLLEAATAPPLVRRVPISPPIAAEVANLPDEFPRDPADRIIVASSRVLGAALLTQDRKIVEAGVVPTI